MERPNPEVPLIGKSAALARIQDLIDKVKDLSTPVFISGESGTGKELIARAIHNRGGRRGGQFVAVNCGAIPELLLESELFGYARGAFTGAQRDKSGLIEEADAGTFFLDEVGDLSLQLQAKLLRLLQEKEIRRIGENRTRHVDVRFISATNKNIEDEVLSGRFREDLSYRLRIVIIEIPPLRERREDLLPLMDHFIEKYSQEIRKDVVFFSPGSRNFSFTIRGPATSANSRTRSRDASFYPATKSSCAKNICRPNSIPGLRFLPNLSKTFLRPKRISSGGS